MIPPKNRDQLIGLLSTASGYADRHPIDAEEILNVLEAAGCTVVPNEATEEMQIAGGLGVRVRAIAKDRLNAAIARSPYRREE